MKEVIEPLALVPGVRLVAMVSLDGIPIAAMRNGPSRSSEEDDAELSSDQGEALSVVAASWLADVTRAVGQLSWNTPHRMLMRTNQGTVVLHQGPGALLVTVLERGTSPEEVRVPMEGAIARMQRVLRGMGAAPLQVSAAHGEADPPGISPAPRAGTRPPIQSENTSHVTRGNE